MIKNTHSQGFAHAVLIIGLVVALIGALGFVFWQNFIHEEPVRTELLKTEVTKNNGDNSAKEEDNKDYLVIKALGVRAKIPESLKDTKIVYTLDGETLYLVTSRVKSILESCNYKDTAGTSVNASVAIERSKSKSMFNGIDAPVLLREEPYAGYYYGYSAPVPLKSCTSSQIDVQKNDAEALIEMFKDLEVVN